MAEALGHGHIHETWRVEALLDAGPSRPLVLQRLNAGVFPDLEALGSNLERVSEAIARAQRARGVRELERHVLRPLRGSDAASLQRDAAGNTWRAFPFIDGSRAFDTADSPARAKEAARAFGVFLRDLSALDPDELHSTIPGFHDLAARADALEDVARRDPHGRAGEVGGELDAARRAAEGFASDDPLPRRIVHNDCKLNNLLFDERSGEALCVLDLDTVMGGSVLFDFGELLRSAACRAAEDERELERIVVELPLLEALAEGFLAGCGELLEPGEIDALERAGPRMATENALRFLSDHLDGDRYFRITRPGQNLDRARAQLRLAEGLREARPALARALARSPTRSPTRSD